MFLLVFLWSCVTLSDLESQVDLQYQAWCAQSETAVVERVYDGDTLFLQGQDNGIRLLGVAAPEVQSSSGPAECFGENSRDFLDALVEGEKIILEFDVECEDIYSRQLSWIFIEGDDPEIAGWMSDYDMMGLNEDGSYRLLVNELILRAGYATVFQGEVAKNIRYTDRLEKAEEEAEEEGLGLWSFCP
ncbi:MAG: thermonuclease family protein [Myxococcota bacterium]|nr:thermonuclease family protein [Myxococcota bacterium]